MKLNEKFKVKPSLFNWALIGCMLMCFAAVATAQNISVSGMVKDATGEPLAGVSISVIGTTLGTVTGIDGRYVLNNVPGAESQLKFSYIGYAAKTEIVGSRRVIDVTLEEDTEMLEEVVVIGYGTVKKSDVTGSVVRLSESVIKEKPVQNVLQAMQGKAPGVDITSNMRPGETGDIRIRGNRSITASNDPLYVIDGIPLVSGSIRDINPNDIASVEILKDASATAIYGSRGANGVILVTLKSGSSGRINIDYDGTETFSTITSLTDWMGSGELLDWRRQAALNGGTYNGAYGTAPDPARDYSMFMGGLEYMRRILATAYQLTDNDPSKPVLRASTAEEQAMGYAAQVPIYDAASLFDQHWPDLILRTGVTSNHQLSLSTGTDISKVYLSVGYLDQNSPMKDQDYNRYTVNLRGEITPKKWLTIGLSTNASYSLQNLGMQNGTSNSGSNDSYGQAVDLLPYAPAYDEDGKILAPTAEDSYSFDNILNNYDKATYEVRQWSIMANAFTEVRFTPWLRYRLNFGSQYRNSRTGYYYAPGFSNPFGSRPVASQANSGYWNQTGYSSYVIENLLYANKTFGDHSLGATLLQSAQDSRSENINLRSLNLLFPTAMFYSLSSNSTSQPYSWGTSYSRSQMMSYMARLNYGLMDKYLLTVTGRWDGASVLAEGNKWDFFPSAALAWKMEQEEFIKSIDVISQMKFRLGYGVTGNSAVSAYSTTGAIRAANYYFNKTVAAGYKSNAMPNAGLGWEKTAQWNLGLDFGILSNRITGSVELYKAETSDLLLDRSLPAITGFTSVRANIGQTENKGLEITLSSVNVDTKDFRWVTDINWSRNIEKIVALNEGVNEDLTNGWFIGSPIQVYYDLEYDRLWQDTPEDKRLMEIYEKASSAHYQAGQVKVVDQPFIEDSSKEGQEGWKTVTLSSGEKVTFQDNGFGTISTGTNTDRRILGTSRPKWVGGLTNTFTYKNFDFSFFIYSRFGNMYYGAMQTYGRRVEKSVWSPTNTNAKFPQPTTAANLTDHSTVRNYTDGSMVTVRNIMLSYTLPESLCKKFDTKRVQIYGQLLNPFIWGGEAVKLGINPDDVNDWRSATLGTGSATGGGSSNNTMAFRSWVLGLRISL